MTSCVSLEGFAFQPELVPKALRTACQRIRRGLSPLKTQQKSPPRNDDRDTIQASLENSINSNLRRSLTYRHNRKILVTAYGTSAASQRTHEICQHSATAECRRMWTGLRPSNAEAEQLGPPSPGLSRGRSLSPNNAAEPSSRPHTVCATLNTVRQRAALSSLNDVWFRYSNSKETNAPFVVSRSALAELLRKQGAVLTMGGELDISCSVASLTTAQLPISPRSMAISAGLPLDHSDSFTASPHNASQYASPRRTDALSAASSPKDLGRGAKKPCFELKSEIRFPIGVVKNRLGESVRIDSGAVAPGDIACDTRNGELLKVEIFRSQVTVHCRRIIRSTDANISGILRSRKRQLGLADDRIEVPPALSLLTDECCDIPVACLRLTTAFPFLFWIGFSTGEASTADSESYNNTNTLLEPCSLHEHGPDGLGRSCFVCRAPAFAGALSAMAAKKSAVIVM